MFNHIENRQNEIRNNILNSFNDADDMLEKGGKPAQIGEKRMFSGREYVKTATGWKFHGKGTGTKAKEHAEGAAKHGESKEKITVNSPSLISHQNLHGKTFDVIKTTEHELSDGSVKFYHIKDEKGRIHEINENFVEQNNTKKTPEENKDLFELKIKLSNTLERAEKHLEEQKEYIKNGIRKSGHSLSAERGAVRDLRTVLNDFNNKRIIGKIARNIQGQYHPYAADIAKEIYKQLSNSKGKN